MLNSPCDYIHSFKKNIVKNVKLFLSLSSHFPNILLVYFQILNEKFLRLYNLSNNICFKYVWLILTD